MRTSISMRTFKTQLQRWIGILHIEKKKNPSGEEERVVDKLVLFNNRGFDCLVDVVA